MNSWIGTWHRVLTLLLLVMIVAGGVSVWVSWPGDQGVTPAGSRTTESLQSLVRYASDSSVSRSQAERTSVETGIRILVSGFDAPAVPLANVRAKRGDDQLGTSGSDGLLTLPPDVVGGERVVLTHDRYESMAICMGPEDTGRTRAISLLPGSVVRGRVRDQAGRPIVGAAVKIERGGVSTSPDQQDSCDFDATSGRPLCYVSAATTDTNGSFRIDGLSRGRHTVAVQRRGFVRDTSVKVGSGARDAGAIGIEIENSEHVMDVTMVAVFAAISRIEFTQANAEQYRECLVTQQMLPRELEAVSGYDAKTVADDLVKSLGLAELSHNATRRVQLAKAAKGFVGFEAEGRLQVSVAGLKSRKWSADLVYRAISDSASMNETAIVVDEVPALARVEVQGFHGVALRATEKGSLMRFTGRREREDLTVFSVPVGRYAVVPEQMGLLWKAIKKHQIVEATEAAPASVIADFGRKLCRMEVDVVDVLQRPVDGCYVRVRGPAGDMAVRSKRSRVSVTCLPGDYVIEVADPAMNVCGTALVHVDEVLPAVVARVQLAYQ
jgi:hypothetical protein